jgi:hypothetical protein
MRSAAFLGFGGSFLLSNSRRTCKGEFQSRNGMRLTAGGFKMSAA